MLMTPSNHAIPLFPDWVFKTSTGITQDHANQILNEFQKLPKIPEDYGCRTPMKQIGSAGLKLTQLTAQIFQQLVSAKIPMTPQHLKGLDTTDFHFMSVNPLQRTQATMTRGRWYVGAVILKKSHLSCNLCLESFDTRFWSTPYGLHGTRQEIELAEFDAVFWPANCPWHFTTNATNENFVAFITTHLIINQHEIMWDDDKKKIR